jgi:hypothetical protein
MDILLIKAIVVVTVAVAVGGITYVVLTILDVARKH